MNPRVTLGFVAAVAILVAVVVGLDRFNISAGGTPTPTPAVEVAVFSFDDKKATGFTVTAGNTTAQFQKSGDTWTIVGSDRPANLTSITSLLIRMSTLKATQKIAATADSLAQFGLDKPKQIATAKLDDGTTYVLQLGNKSTVGTSTYARDPSASDVYLLTGTLGDDIQRLATAPEEPPTATPRPTSTPTPVVETTPTPTPTP